MVPLPGESLARFEVFLERTWWHGKTGARRRDALILGMLLCGLRWVETERLLCEYVQWSSGTVTVKTAKRGRNRTITLGESYVAAVKEWRRMIGRPLRAGQALWITRTGKQVSYEQVRRTCREWTRTFFGQAYTPHCLRHTAAVRCYWVNRDVLEVQHLLGHKSLQHTQEYLATIIPVAVDGLPAFARDEPGRELGGLRLFDPDGDGRRAG